MLKELIKERNIPEVWPDKTVPWEVRQKEILSMVEKYEYGKVLNSFDRVEFETVREFDQMFGDKAVYREVKITVWFGEESFSFRMIACIPKSEGKHPFFVHITHLQDRPGWDVPGEELIDRGFAYLAFNYTSISGDNSDCDGAYPLLVKGTEDDPVSKIACWSWGASRVLDYAETCPELDMSRSAVVGVSRLGKTSLFAGMEEPRFAYVISHASGAGGAAVYRGIKLETLDDVIRKFPFWFNKTFTTYSGRVDEFPLDQHFLIAACAPRKVYVSGSDRDIYCDQDSMYLACKAASEVYETMGLKGFVAPDRLPETWDVLHEGEIGFHLRPGTHSMIRTDWNYFMDFILR